MMFRIINIQHFTQTTNSSSINNLFFILLYDKKIAKITFKVADLQKSEFKNEYIIFSYPFFLLVPLPPFSILFNLNIVT